MSATNIAVFEIKLLRPSYVLSVQIKNCLKISANILLDYLIIYTYIYAYIYTYNLLEYYVFILNTFSMYDPLAEIN